MKKAASFVLFAMLCGLAGASSATIHVQVDCGKAKCPTPPAPPAPPVPPVPPVPPAPPALPAVPAPPPPPEIPDVPAGAHAACAGKAPSTEITFTIRQGEYMRGVCKREDGKMVFVLRLYHLD